ncbi:hypothetical protein V5799_004235 [Amblyomma americanum]|uniref:Transposase Helix-turn-helix domain-containing protein n=1 Tax=Amblyomma americanum TaxID=6943 RepID=A0AAQ4D6N9_AMBAM
MEELSSNGLTWRASTESMASKVYCFSCCVDSPARAAMQHFTQFNGYYGCSWCLHPGKTIDGTVKYPVNCVVRDRSMEGTKKKMHRAVATGEVIKGLKGVTPLINLAYFDVIWSFSPDYMHCVLLGVSRQLTECWLSNVVAKHKNTSSKTASASPVLLLNELEIGCVVDVPQCDQSADHLYSMGPPDAASDAALRKVAHLLEHCEKLEHENSLLRKDKSELQKEVEDLKSQLNDVKVEALKEKLKLKDCVSKVHDFVPDEKRLVFYTGFNSFKKFDAFIEHVECMYQALKTGAGRPPALTMKEQLIAVLCRLRVGLLEQDLAHRLKVSVATKKRWKLLGKNGTLKKWFELLKIDSDPLESLNKKNS